MLRIFFVSIMFALITLVGCSEEDSPTKRDDSSLVFSRDGAWCWFQDPRAVYVEGQHKRTYTGWMTSNGKLQVGAYDHSTGLIDKFTLKEKWDIDDHNNNSFLVLPDRRIMVFYARHNKTGLFARVTSKPEDISQWENEITVANTPGITYSHPVYLKNEGCFYVFWRGQSWKPTFSTSTDNTIWSAPRILVQQKGREALEVRPYIKVVSDGTSSIHFAFTDDHPHYEPENSIYYLKYENEKFYKADGTQVGTVTDLPVQPSQSDIVDDGKRTKVRAWVWDIAIDRERHPVIAYTRLPSENDHRYHYARWNGGVWMDTEVVPGGKWFPQTPLFKHEDETYYSGGIAIHHADPSIVYLSRQVDGVFEIEK